MGKSVSPGIIAIAIVGLLVVVGIVAYLNLRRPRGTATPQQDIEVKQMMQDPISQGKGGRMTTPGQ